MNSVAVILTSLAFAAAALASFPLAQALTQSLERFSDGPQRVEISRAYTALAAAICGAFVGAELGLPGSFWYVPAVVIFVTALVSDARTGRIPDLLVIPAIVAVVVFGLVGKNLDPLIGAALLFAIFGLTALCTKGLGIGWGDVYLLSLAGAIFHPEPALIGAFFACILVIASSVIRRRLKDPVAFAPYIAAAFGIVATFSL